MFSRRLIYLIGLLIIACLSGCGQPAPEATRDSFTLPSLTSTESPEQLAVTQTEMPNPTITQTITPFPTATPTQGLGFAAHPLTKDLKGAHSIDLADMDDDGDLDIIAAGWNAGAIRWWQNTGAGNFNENTITDDFLGVRYILAVDLDNDGDMDLLGAAQESEIGLIWWENDGAGIFTENPVTDRYKGVSTVDAADLDSDGDLDIVSGTSTFNDLVWWENDGNASFTQHDIPQNVLEWISYLDLADLDGDGQMDILGVGYTSDSVAWWRNNGGGNFSAQLIDRNYPGGHTVRTSDLDLDGDLDIIGTAHGAGEFSWWRNSGTGYFEKFTVAEGIPGAIYLDASDLDGDGDLDLVSASEIAWLVAWFENDGAQNFTRHDISTSFAGSSCVMSADLDADGDLDIVGAGVGGNGSVVWWENMLDLSLVATMISDKPPSVTKTLDIPSEKVSFVTEDDVQLGATLFGTQDDLVVLLLHMGKAKGSNNTQKDWHSFARFLAENGYTSLTLDFRGRGESSGDVRNDLLPLDILAAIQYLQEQGYERFVCVGAGMGGTTCMRLALDGVDLDGLVVLAASLQAGPNNQVTTAEIPRIQIPKFYIYGENDGYGFSDAMEKIYAASTYPKELLICPDTAAHGTELLNMACGDEIRKKMMVYLNALR